MVDPDTNPSLLQRVKDSRDDDAWGHFESIYQPIIFRMARRRGLKHDDAMDVAQQVLTSVMSKLPDWEQNAQQGRFRSWLNTVTRNAAIDRLRRLRPDAGRGGTSMVLALNRLPQSDAAEAQEIENEYRRQLFREAASEICNEFDSATWDAFRMTMIEQQDITDVARELNKSVGALYAARSRCMKRLRERGQQMLAADREAKS